MSTKNLREVVEAYIKLTGPWDGRSQRTANAQAALAELETIERAAMILAAWNRDGRRTLDSGMARAWTVIEHIAKEAS